MDKKQLETLATDIDGIAANLTILSLQFDGNSIKASDAVNNAALLKCINDLQRIAVILDNAKI